MPDPTTILLAHVIKTMPDDLTDRRQLLVAMRAKMSRSHPAFAAVCKQIEAIDNIRQLDAEAQLSFAGLLTGGQQ